MNLWLFIAFLLVLIRFGNCQTFYFEPFYQFAWNAGSGTVNFSYEGPDATTIQCSYTVGDQPFSRFSLDSAGPYPPYDSNPNNQTFDIPIIWGGANTSPGGFAEITCQDGNENSGTAKVQLLFPPGVAIYPEVLHLPRDNQNASKFYSFQVALTEVPVDNAVNITCTRDDVTNNPFNIQFRGVKVEPDDATAPSVFFEARYFNSVTSEDAFTCSAASRDGGTQYLKETSGSNTATFKVNPLGQISIKPQRQTITGRNATAFLELDQPQGISMSFKCSVRSALPNPNPANPTECAALTGNESWKQPGTIQIPARSKTSIIRLWKERAAEITGIENVFVYCCGIDGSTDGLFTSASINLNYSPKQVGLSSTSLDDRTPFDDPKWVNPAGCQCDLLANDCDINCCCDSDCSSQTIAAFDCLPGSSTDSDENVDEKNCEKSEDTNPFFCVQRSYTNWLGYYYPDVTRASENDVRFNQDQGYKTGVPQVIPSTDSSSAYKKGQNIATTIDSQNKVFVPFPEQIIPGMCFYKSRVQFLVDRSVSCSIVATQANCETPTSPLNARNYMVSQDRTYPRPLSYFGFTNITSTFRCPNSAGGGLESDDCWFNDQENILPPEPVFSSASGTCSNVVLEATYNFKWRGNSIVGVETIFVFGKISVAVGTPSSVNSFGFVNSISEQTDVPESVDDLGIPATVGAVDYGSVSEATFPQQTNPSSVFAQKFTVSFTYQPEDASVVAEKRSGNPGYVTGLPVLTAIGTLTNGSLNSLQLSSSALRSPKATSGGSLCDRSSSLGINFQTNVTSSCLVELKYSDFQDCANLTTTILDKLPEFPNNVYIARRGNSQVANLGDWISFFKESETDAIWGNYSEFIQNVLGNQSTEDNPERENITDVYRDRKGLCRNMPVGHSIEFLVSDAGVLNGVIQYEIIASRLRMLYKDLEMNCFKVSNPNLCDPDSTDTQKFLLTSHVKFFTVPNPANQPRKPKSELKREERENCDTNDICWGDMFYPLRKPPGSERIKFLLFQENVFFTIVIVIITLFVWRFSSLWMGKLK